MSSQKLWLALPAYFFLVISLSACVSTGPSEPTEPGAVEMDRSKLPPEPNVQPPSARPSARAVDTLVTDSRREYERGDWQAAIATAERALRIDRRQPEVYLIIAKSYRALGDRDQALQFVEQGLRYIVDDNTDAARELSFMERSLKQ